MQRWDKPNPCNPGLMPYANGEWVRYSDHEQALAEKDREITHLQDVYTKQRHEHDDNYQQLMEKAVRFGECLTDDCRCTPEEVNTSPECAFIKARLFLQSPEVQAWKERKP